VGKEQFLGGLGRESALETSSLRGFGVAMLACVFLAFAAFLIFGAGAGRAASKDDGQPSPAQPKQDHGHGHWFKHACDDASGPNAACDAEVVTDANGDPLAGSTPPAGAYGPAQFHAGYGLPMTSATPQTIAIVDAYDDPNIEADLGVYDTAYGLPPCTTANGCFRKVNQSGGTSYPARNSGWALEIALDVETAHQICQNCKILLVEATSNSLANLGAAVNEAAALGANEISNSYGAGEFSGETGYEGAYNHPGIVVTVSAGDNGYGVEFPAASQYVTAVGGTSLNLNANNTYNSETVWSGTGSGCSVYEPKPLWQSDSAGCGMRTVADVSADADPNTGAAVYATYGYTGWVQVGGTSLAAPLIAAVYALGASGSVNDGSRPYSYSGLLHDVTSGNNGSCSPPYLCTAGVGFDGPTGLGTPNGLGAFGAGTATAGFSLGVSPSSQTVTQGGTTTYTVTAAASGGFSGSVALSESGLPTGADVSFNPSSITTTTSSTLTVTATSLPAGSYPFTIGGTSGGLTASTSATLVVQAPVPPPTLTVSPSAVAPGGTVKVSWSGVVGPSSTDWIGLFTPGAPDNPRLGWFYDSSCNQRPRNNRTLSSGSCSFKMPNTAGTYEFRLFADNSSTPVATSSSVTVG